jgi:hypothetical protein
MIEELHTVYEMSNTEWLQATPVASFLCTQLGYEDVAELEDALHGTFSEFLRLLPDVEIRIEESKLSNSVVQEEDDVAIYFKVKPEISPDEWVSKKMSYRITQRGQLWNVFLKSPYCRVEIVEAGLEISADGRKKIDTIWNYLSSAALDLGMHVQSNRGMSDGDTDKTVAVIESLAQLRDVETPWTFLVIDPSGISEFTDMSLVEVTEHYVDEGSHVDVAY